MTRPPLRVSRKTSRPSARRIAEILTIILFVWLAVTSGLGLLARSDATCASCHPMSPYTEALSHTSHKALGCADCHVDRSAAALLPEGLALQRRALATLVGKEPSPLSPVDDATCRACHTRTLEQTVQAQGIAVRHSDFATVLCSECHAGTGHSVAGEFYPTYGMDDCLTCHRTSAENLAGCEICHVSGSQDASGSVTPWGVVHGPNWERTHGAGDLDTCRSCHGPDYCVDCHGVSLPHPATWPRYHGAFVVLQGRESCPTCHDPEWCDRCHGLPMPHPDDFMSRHPSDTNGLGDPRCVRCHDIASCTDCHYRAAHPNVPGAGFPHSETGGS